MAKESWMDNAMLAERNRLAKALNQRMVRLERADVDYGAIVQYQDFIKEYYGVSKTGKLRFPERRWAETSEKWNRSISLRREVDVLNYFMYQPQLPKERKWKTIFPAGAKATMKKYRDTFASYGLTFPNDYVMREFLESESWRAMKKMYDSKIAVRLAGTRKYRTGGKDKRTSVEVMDERLAKFIKRMGEGYNIKNMTAEDVAKIFGVKTAKITEFMMEDDLP